MTKITRVLILAISFTVLHSMVFAQNNVIPGVNKPLVEGEITRDAFMKKIEPLENVIIDNVSGTADLNLENPALEIKQGVQNTKATRFDLSLKLPNAVEKRVLLKPNQSSAVTWSIPLKVRPIGKKVRSVNVAPQMSINGALPIKPVKKYAIKVILPADAKKLIKSNKPLKKKEATDGRMTYEWAGQNEYMTTLSVWWTTSDLNLAMAKELKPDWQNAMVTITLKVNNEGSTPAKNIVLKEDFPSQSFEGMSDSNGTFTVYKGQFNDQRLLWEHNIQELSPGSKTTVIYKLKMKEALPEIRLYETRAFEEGELVATTDAITVKK